MSNTRSSFQQYEWDCRTGSVGNYHSSRIPSRLEPFPPIKKFRPAFVLREAMDDEDRIPSGEDGPGGD